MTGWTKVKLEAPTDPGSLVRRVVEWMLVSVGTAGGIFAVALSVGSTPRLDYELLAGPPYRDVLHCDRIVAAVLTRRGPSVVRSKGLVQAATQHPASRLNLKPSF